MITSKQKAYFDTFGFIHLPKQFSAEEIDALTREADKLWKLDRDGRPFGGEGQGIQEFVEKGPVMTRFVEDDRIWGTVEALLGPRFLWNGSEGNLTVHTEHHWHTDRPNDPHATTYSFHLYLALSGRIRGAFALSPALIGLRCTMTFPPSTPRNRTAPWKPTG